MQPNDVVGFACQLFRKLRIANLRELARLETGHKQVFGVSSLTFP